MNLSSNDYRELWNAIRTMFWPTIWDANAQEIVESSVVGNPFMFTGRRYDPETGLYYYRARYYAPYIGRFGG
jgi:RHS repeat-associated protein